MHMPRKNPEPAYENFYDKLERAKQKYKELEAQRRLDKLAAQAQNRERARARAKAQPKPKRRKSTRAQRAARQRA